MDKIEKLALFGGSFDPPHLGHLAIARAAQASLALDRVLFAPVGSQPLKPQGSTASFEHRLQMVRLAIADEPAFALSEIDAPQPSGRPNFTLDTLLRLRASFDHPVRLFCLMGADSFHLLRNWYRAAELPFAAELIVATRPGILLNQLAAELPEGIAMDPDPCEVLHEGENSRWSYRLSTALGAESRLHLLAAIEHPASATTLRHGLMSGFGSSAQSHPHLPESVAGYIRRNILYQ